MRRFSETDYSSLKRAIEIAYELAGGVSLIQHITRVVVSQLSKYASTDSDSAKKFMPIDVAVDVDRAAKQPIVTGRMAELLGFRLVPLEEMIVSSDPLSEADALKIMDEASDFWRLTRQAYEDGRLDARERQALRAKLRRLIDAAYHVTRKLDELEVLA